jgi:predicted transcriptional regulator
VAKKVPPRPHSEKIVDETIMLKRPRRGARLREEVWQTEDGRVTKYNLAYINQAVCQADNGRVLDYDNSHDFHHRHFMGEVKAVKFKDYETLASRFRERCKNCGVRKMKKAKSLSVSTGTTEDFFERSLGRARGLDRGEKLAAEMRLSFEDPADLLRVLTAQRVRVIHAIRKKPAPVSDLAIVLKRDRTAVRRDVKILRSFGLVKIQEEANPGHGRRKIVLPLASKYELIATI